MDPESEQKLRNLLQGQRVAALGTLHEGAPLVTMSLFAPAADYREFYILASTLAHHTRDMQNDPRVSLLLAEPDLGQQDPQTLARLSIRGEAQQIASDAPEWAAIRNLYLARFPDSAPLFGFSDFSLYRITAQSARYVAGFARAFNLAASDLTRSGNQD